MPAWAASTSYFLHTTEQHKVWDAESVAANSASQSVQIERRKSNNQYPWGFAVQVAGTTSLGTFDIEVQGSETDTDATYVKLASITTANSSNVGRGDYVTYWPRYVRLFVRTLTGNVTVTAIISR